MTKRKQTFDIQAIVKRQCTNFSNAEQVQDAIKFFQKSNNGYEKSVNLLCQAEIYYETDKYEEAISHYTQALTLEPDNLLALAHRGNSYRMLEKDNLSYKDFESALNHPDANNNPELHKFILMRCSLIEGVHKQQFSIYRAQAEIETQCLELNRLAAEADREGNWPKALALFKASYIAGNSKALRKLAAIYYQQGLFQDAYHHYKQIIREGFYYSLPIKTQTLIATRLIDSCFNHSNTLSESKKDKFLKRLDYSPFTEGDLFSLSRKAAIKEAQNCLPDALALFNQALKEKQNDLYSLNGLTRCYIQTNQHDDALKIIEQILDHSPNDSQALINKTFVKLEQKKYEEALAAWNKISEPPTKNLMKVKERYEQLEKRIFPAMLAQSFHQIIEHCNDINALYTLCLCYLKLDQYNAFTTTIERMKALSPKKADLLLHYIARKQNHIPNSITIEKEQQLFENIETQIAAIEDPNFQISNTISDNTIDLDFLNAMAYWSIRNKDYKTASLLLDKILKYSPENAHALLSQFYIRYMTKSPELRLAGWTPIIASDKAPKTFKYLYNELRLNIGIDECQAFFAKLKSHHAEEGGQQQLQIDKTQQEITIQCLELNSLAALEEQEGNWSRALELLNASYAAGNKEALIKRADIYYKQELIWKACHDYNKLTSMPTPLSLVASKPVKYLATLSQETQKLLLTRFIDSDLAYNEPDDLPNQKNFDKIFKTYFSENDPFVLSRKAAICERENALLEAITLFTKAITEKPDDLYALNGLTRCYIKQEKYDKALEIIDEISHISSDDNQALLNKTIIEVNQKKYDTALQNWNKLSIPSRNNIMSVKMMYHQLRERILSIPVSEHFTQFIKNYKETRIDEKTKIDSLHKLCFCYLAQKYFSTAQLIVNSLKILFPNELIPLAIEHHILGKADLMTTSLALPSKEELEEQISSNEEDPADASRILSDIINNTDSDIELLNDMADYFIKIGEYDSAYSLLNNILTNSPCNKRALHNQFYITYININSNLEHYLSRIEWQHHLYDQLSLEMTLDDYYSHLAGFESIESIQHAKNKAALEPREHLPELDKYHIDLVKQHQAIQNQENAKELTSQEEYKLPKEKCPSLKNLCKWSLFESYQRGKLRFQDEKNNPILQSASISEDEFNNLAYEINGR